MLLVQQALPCLLFTYGHPMVKLKGGTNAEMAPQVDYVLHVLQPILKDHFGINMTLEVVRRGYFPKGGGEIYLQVTPIKEPLHPISLMDRGQLVSVHVRSFVAGSIPLHVMLYTRRRYFSGSFVIT
jgi:RNA 3'-terminal phosphate cyclase (ATP)